jgi:hypothetical protein
MLNVKIGDSSIQSGDFKLSTGILFLERTAQVDFAVSSLKYPYLIDISKTFMPNSALAQ